MPPPTSEDFDVLRESGISLTDSDWNQSTCELETTQSFVSMKNKSAKIEVNKAQASLEEDLTKIERRKNKATKKIQKSKLIGNNKEAESTERNILEKKMFSVKK